MVSNWMAGALIALVLGGLLVFGVWTWRRLWRSGRTPWERIVYDQGVKRFGLATGVGLALLPPAIEWGPLRLVNVFTAAYVAEAVVGALVGLPIALWGGYLWGRTMADVVGRSDGRP